MRLTGLFSSACGQMVGDLLFSVFFPSFAFIHGIILCTMHAPAAGMVLCVLGHGKQGI